MTKQELDHVRYVAQKDTPEYKARRAATQRKYRQSHLDAVRQGNRKWYHSRHPLAGRYGPKVEKPYRPYGPRLSFTNLDGRMRLKIEVFSHYGPEGKLQCAWSDCAVTDVDMLSLDHVNDDGAADRGSAHRGRGGHVTYQRVRAQGYPAGFQTLCHNHQWKKELMRRRAISSSK